MSDIKNRIIEESIQLFMRYGIRSVTMSDLSNHLTVSKKTLYKYFSDKDDLVKSCVMQHAEEDMCEMESIKASRESAIDEVCRLSSHIRVKLKTINPAMIYDMQKYHTEAWVYFSEHMQRCYRASLVESMQRGVEEGYFREDIDFEIVSASRLHTVFSAFDPQVFPISKFHLTDVQVQLFDLFVFGIVTPKGYEAYSNYKQTLK